MSKYQEDELDLLCLSCGLAVLLLPLAQCLTEGCSLASHSNPVSFIITSSSNSFKNEGPF